MKLNELSRKELEALFEERKKALREVRDEIDRRDREKGRPGVNIDFCKYVADGSED